MRKLYIIILIVFAPVFFLPELYSQKFAVYQAGIDRRISYSSVALGDIDRDGDLDLVAAGSSNTVYIFSSYTNNGHGIFIKRQNINSGCRDAALALADINNDGYPDIVMTGWELGAAYVFRSYLNNGTGQFAFLSNIGAGVYRGDNQMGDLDKDGDLDLVMTGYSGAGDYFKLYFNDGMGNFSFQADIDTGGQISANPLVDLDLDNDLDILFGGANADKYSSYRNDGNGNFSSLQLITNTTTPPWILAAGDLDADGDMDIVDSSRTFKNNGSGLLFYAGTFGVPATGYPSLVLGDVDQDGDLDLIKTGLSGGSFYHFELLTNSGNGVFASAGNIDAGISASGVALGDIDNDGDLDIIKTGYPGFFNSYTNASLIKNNPPSVPAGFDARDDGNGNLVFSWDVSADDHTPQNMIRYNIAIGRNTSGQYEFISDALYYPEGGANVGNVRAFSSRASYYSKIPVGSRVFYKVLAIDSAFCLSAYSAEQAYPPAAETNAVSRPLLVGPNPVRKSMNSSVLFQGFSNGDQVKIFTVRGDPVKSFVYSTGSVWDLKTNSGNTVAEGVYIVKIIRAGGQTVYQKLVIEP